MTRQIKFRAWDKDFNSMVANVSFRHGGSVNGMFDSERFIFMQFTGLLDKNGKEIYEGDVLRNSKSALPSDQHIKVHFENGSFMGDYIRLHQHEPENCLEVIGNIYENSELLT